MRTHIKVDKKQRHAWEGRCADVLKHPPTPRRQKTQASVDTVEIAPCFQNPLFMLAGFCRAAFETCGRFVERVETLKTKGR